MNDSPTDDASFAYTHGATAEPAYADSVAGDWWDPHGRFSALARLNPLRLSYVERVAGGLRGKRVLDVGCGGGLLAEAMALRGARVTGLDIAEGALTAAISHAPAGLDLQYVQTTLRRYLEIESGVCGTFDVVVCMELLEHVSDPQTLVRDCAYALAAGGTVVYSTLNRSPPAYFAAIVGAEYLSGIVPMGTHQYQRFLRPAELAGMAHLVGLEVCGVDGVVYVPVLQRACLTRRPCVNYLLYARRPTQVRKGNESQLRKGGDA